MKRKVHAHEKTGELNIVPYLDIMVNLTMFMLVSMTSVIQLAIINVNVPIIGGAPPPGKPGETPPVQRNLTVLISPKGFYIGGTGGIIPGESPPGATGAAATTTPPTVPVTADGKYDYTLLKRKMVDVKDKWSDESKVILSADPTVNYEVIVKTMDAIRDDGQRKLFYDVVLGAM